MLDFLIGLVKAGIQLLVLGIILSPLVVVYILGLYVSTAISLWRLIQHDYAGNTDENANMKPALDVLYSLAVIQGVVYGYRASHSPARKNIAELIIRYYEFDRVGSASVWEYLEDTMAGCEKDPTFARGRNLITYAVDLMESNSPDSFLSGARILDTMLSQQQQQHTLIKHLIGSSSSSPVLQKLLQALGTRSPCNRETRRRAARIVKHLAGDIHLEQFPHRGIQHISSLIGTFEEYSLLEPYLRDWLVEDKEHKWHQRALRLSNSDHSYYGGYLWKEYKDLFLQGMRILRKLATDEKNARIISDTQGLLSKIMAPVTSDLLHHIDHDEWSSVVKGSLKVIRQLVSAPGEAGANMRRDISGNTQVISTMNRILSCDKCDYDEKELSIRILTRLYMDTQVTQDFVRLLLHRFIGGSTMDQAGGEALAMLSSTGGSNVMTILQSEDDVISNLSTVLLDVEPEWCCRIHAAKILEHLCIHHTKGDGRLEAMIDVMPKLLGEILPEEPTEIGTGAGFSSLQADIEGQHGGASQANDQKKKNEKISKLREPFLSLCVTVCETFISADLEKARQFSAILESSLPRKLEALVRRISKPTTDNLRILKLTSRMVISMVKHEGTSCYCKHDLESLMQALSIALKNMVPVDGSISMYSASGDGEGDGTTATKPFRSLASLVEEAKEIVSKYYEAEEPEIKELSTSADGEP